MIFLNEHVLELLEWSQPLLVRTDPNGWESTHGVGLTGVGVQLGLDIGQESASGLYTDTESVLQSRLCMSLLGLAGTLLVRLELIVWSQHMKPSCGVGHAELEFEMVLVFWSGRFHPAGMSSVSERLRSRFQVADIHSTRSRSRFQLPETHLVLVFTKMRIGSYKIGIPGLYLRTHGGNNILFTKPWQYDHKVTHDGVINRFSFIHRGQKVTLKLLSPKEVNKDHVKMMLRKEKKRKDQKEKK
ncbi:hypothetical protein CR513_31495, partial [Mucuna pruriens]